MASAVVLLSGGLDSATCLAIARARGDECACLAFDYGQRHRVELQFAQRQAETQGAAEFTLVPIHAGAFAGGSVLTGLSERPLGGLAPGIPATYVPARNVLFLSYALAKAEIWGGRRILIGVNALDYSGYPDCRPEFIAAFQRMADLATFRGTVGHPIEIEAPLQHLTKGEIVAQAVRLGVRLDLTTSCYAPGPSGEPCGHCDACRLRAKGFEEAGLADPALAR